MRPPPSMERWPYTSAGRPYANELGPPMPSGSGGRLQLSWGLSGSGAVACLQLNQTMRISHWGVAAFLLGFYLFGGTNHVFSPIQSPGDRPAQASEGCNCDCRGDGHLRMRAVVWRHRCRVVPRGYKAGTKRQSKSQCVHLQHDTITTETRLGSLTPTKEFTSWNSPDRLIDQPARHLSGLLILFYTSIQTFHVAPQLLSLMGNQKWLVWCSAVLCLLPLLIFTQFPVFFAQFPSAPKSFCI